MKKFTLVFFTSVLFLTGCTSKAPNLGVANGQLTPCPDKPNCVNSFSKDEEQFIKPIIVTGTKLAIINAIIKIINEIDNAEITVTENNYIRAEFTSDMLGFVDDVEFYFPEVTANNTTIHVRSGSRVGYSDFSVNRDRIELLRLKFAALNNKL